MSISEKNPKLAKLAGSSSSSMPFPCWSPCCSTCCSPFCRGCSTPTPTGRSIPCQLIHLNLGPVDTYVFNYPVTGDATGGMGYFAAFAITLFLAQCVNFPMQRNITFKSKGNIWYQILCTSSPLCSSPSCAASSWACMCPVQAVLLPGGVQRAHHRDQRRRADGDLFPHL